MVEFNYAEFESKVVLNICDNIIDGLKEQGLPWDEDLKDVDGFVITHNNVVYCLIEKSAPVLVYLHEAIHCIDQLYQIVWADVDVKNDEVYVRQVSTLQKLFLEEAGIL